ncbi:MAG TPA: helix-turn-helix domain-containing protein [Thermoplasmata archaeon]|nr:helix-turn-helix domain-containing protein [Thermoplasmata archaeon]
MAGPAGGKIEIPGLTPRSIPADRPRRTTPQRIPRDPLSTRALEPLSARSAGRGFQDLLVARLRVVLPEGMPLSEFTRRYPGSALHIMDRVPMGDGKTLLIRFEVDNIDPALVAQDLYTNPKVAEVWLAAAGPGRRSFVVRTYAPPYVRTLLRFAVLRWLPITVRAGVADWTVLCPRADWHPFLADLQKRVPEVTVVATGVHSLRSPEGPLTRRQAEVYRQAVIDGYYELPRRISMSDLAKKLGCSKSTLFEVLRRAERKMMRHDVIAAPTPLIAVRAPPPTPRGPDDSASARA